MKKIFALLCLAAVSLPAQAASIVGTDYDTYRLKLLKQGWKPHGLNMREDGSCPDSDDRCSYSEAVACSGTGLGFCSMVWRRGSKFYTVVTSGEGQLLIASDKMGKP
jgi:hypothetical protein